ncbi:Repeat domain-containing protein, partial [Nannocystis exedens]
MQAAFDLGDDDDEARWRVEVGGAEEGEDDGAAVDVDEDDDDGDDDDEDDDDEVQAPATDRGGRPHSGSVSGAARAEDSDEPRDAWWQDGAGTTFAVLGGNGEAALRDQSAFTMIPRAEIASLRDRAVWPIQKMQALAAAVTDEVAPWSMGCCAVSGKRLAIATIGDVRAYRLRGSRGIELLTGPAASAEIAVWELEGAALDIFVLCTRGLWFGKGAAWLGHIGWGLLEPAWWVGAGRDDLVLVGGSSYLARHTWQPSAAALEVWRSDAASAYVENDVALATGDLDDDHLLDFAAAAQGTLDLFHGRADRGFERRAQFELEERATAMVIADVTGDGRSEIVIHEDTHVRALFRGDDGQYAAGPRFEPAVSPRALVPLRTGPNQPSEHDPDVPTTCPECGQAVPRHDTRTRRWRHLDTCQYRTIIEAGVPRTSCPKHGTLTMRVSWADGSARLTALFEALVIDWLRDAPIAVVAERLGLSWDQV